MKKRFFILICFLFLSEVFVIAQKNQNSYFFNEVGISLNHSTFVTKYYETNTSFGFGAMLYLSLRNGKKISPVFGAEYNLTNFTVISPLKVDVSSYLTDTHFQCHQIRFPFSLRFLFGSKNAFFLEPGFFLNILAQGSFRGILHNNYSTPGSDSTFLYNSRLKGNLTLGSSIGIGTKLSFISGNLIVRVDLVNGFFSNLVFGDQGNYTKPLFYNSYTRFSVIYQLKPKTIK